jgi:ribosomal-protein-alanine N-acetyltransferase
MAAKDLADELIVLSPLGPGDADAWLAGQDEEQIRWFEFPRYAEMEDVQRFISETRESWRNSSGHWYWGIRAMSDGSLLGGVDLRDLGNSEVNVSYVIFPNYRNQGYAKRASILALGYARDTLGAKTAVMKMLPGNRFSMKLARSLGGNYVGNEPSDAGSEFMIFKLDLAS